MPSNAIHGKNAIIYVSPGTGAAVPLGEQIEWSIDYDQPLVDVSPLANNWKNFVKGMMGWSGAFSGNFDLTSATLWTASTGSTLSKFYLYPQGASNMARYYYGTGWIILGKVAQGSTTSKANSSFKITGDDALSVQ